jgi:hypothetical protein
MLAVILLHSLLEYPLWYGPFQIAFGAGLGWLGATAATAQPGRQTARESGPVAPHAPSLAAAAALLALLAYAAWDYERVSQIYLAPEQRRPTWQQDTLEHVRRSWLFAGQAGFAELTLASVTRQNAARLEGLAHEMLHYSPEPRVIERVIESETLLGRSDEAVVDLARYRAAFPGDYQAWRSAQVQR